MTTIAALIALVLLVTSVLLLVTAVIVKTFRDGSLQEDVDYVRYIVRNWYAKQKYTFIRNH